MNLQTLPGGDLIESGLRDLAAGVESEASLLVSLGAPKLKRVGVDVPEPLLSPERRLYALLQRKWGDAAHSKYNALIRRLQSFARSVPFAT